mgnify:FL=1
MVWNITLHFFLANPIATVLIFQSYCFMNTALTSPGIFISPYGICTFQEIICPALFFSCPIIMFLLPIEDHIRILLRPDEFRTLRLYLPVLRIFCLALSDQPAFVNERGVEERSKSFTPSLFSSLFRYCVMDG